MDRCKMVNPGKVGHTIGVISPMAALQNQYVCVVKNLKLIEPSLGKSEMEGDRAGGVTLLKDVLKTILVVLGGRGRHQQLRRHTNWNRGQKGHLS
jgi:hypothetical protein